MSFVISKPANTTSSMANLNFLGFRVMLFRPHMSSHWDAWKKLSSMVSANRMVSSMHFVWAGKVDTISSFLLEYPSPDAM